MGTSALRRLIAEYKQILKNAPDGIMAGPIKEENYFEWEAAITGPEGTLFEDGVFLAKLIFPQVCRVFQGHPLQNFLTILFQDYPLNPPTMRFTSKIFHPNIYPDGKVCISILHPPGDDPLGYEKSSERWSPVQSVEKILLSVMSMIAEPNINSPANVDAAKMWRDEKDKFAEIAQNHVRLSIEMPEKDYFPIPD